MAYHEPISDARRAAVMAALLTGQSVTQVAEEYKLSKASVSRIKSSIDPKIVEQAETEKRKDLNELLLELVTTNIETLTAQSLIVRDSGYIKAQSADNLAVLYGVIADKTVRILAALEPER